MRLRNNPEAPQILKDQKDIVIHLEDSPKGNWNKIFGNNNPIHIEVGMGKGDFISEMAILNPGINYIGIEKYATVTALALKKVNSKDNPANLRLLNIDAENLSEYFAKGEIDKVYLNFSDPWPKKRHARRRLTNIKFIERYKEVTKLPFELELKTDNDGLYEYTVEHFNENKIKIIFKTDDLHNGKHNLQVTPFTEYERKFKNNNKNINKLIAIIK